MLAYCAINIQVHRYRYQQKLFNYRIMWAYASLRHLVPLTIPLHPCLFSITPSIKTTLKTTMSLIM